MCSVDAFASCQSSLIPPMPHDASDSQPAASTHRSIPAHARPSGLKWVNGRSKRRSVQEGARSHRLADTHFQMSSERCKSINAAKRIYPIEPISTKPLLLECSHVTRGSSRISFTRRGRGRILYPWRSSCGSPGPLLFFCCAFSLIVFRKGKSKSWSRLLLRKRKIFAKLEEILIKTLSTMSSTRLKAQAILR